MEGYFESVYEYGYLVKLKVMLPVVVVVEVMSIMLLIWMTIEQGELSREATQYGQRQRKMLSAADELRKSSDNLTRFARSYVVTGDTSYKNDYNEVLEIRNGTVGRPDHYESGYWDLGKQERLAQHPYKEQQSLESIFLSLPYVDSERQLLLLSKKNSDQLVKLERQAFQMMSTAPTQPLRAAEADTSLAIDLLYSPAYAQAKRSIMSPIDQLIVAVTHRTESEFEQIHQKTARQLFLILVLLGFFLAWNLALFWGLKQKVNQPLAYLNNAFLRLKNGETVEEPVYLQDEFGELIRNFFQMEKKLAVAQIRLAEKAEHLELQKVAYQEAQLLGKIGHWQLTADWQSWSGSEQWWRIFGVGSEEFSGSYDGFLGLIHEDDQARIDAAFHRVTPDAPYFTEVFQVCIGCDTIRHIRVCAETNFDDQNILESWFGTMQDITEEVSLNNQLEWAKAQAETANEAKSTFLTMMSHELRTPLNGVLGMAQLLGMTELEPVQQGYVKTIVRSGNSLVAILTDILDFAKIESGKQQLIEAPFSITELVQSLVDLFGGAAAAKGLRLESSISADISPSLIGDGELLRRVLSNLLGNAVKFTNEGRIELRLNRLFESDGQQVVQFYVIDTGIGVSDDKHSTIFEPFRQADEASTRSFGGTGLGLSIVKELVEMMGGAIMLESRSPQGSSFSFELAFKVHVEAEVPPLHFMVDSQRGAKKFSNGDAHALLVEDDFINQKVIVKMLEQMGVNVDVAANGALGLEQARTKHYKFILTDLLMPSMDGYQMTEQIRSNPCENQHTPIIALTAMAGKKDLDRCLKVGMNDYLTKPLDFNLLQKTLEQYS